MFLIYFHALAMLERATILSIAYHNFQYFVTQSKEGDAKKRSSNKAHFAVSDADALTDGDDMTRLSPYPQLLSTVRRRYRCSC